MNCNPKHDVMLQYSTRGGVLHIKKRLEKFHLMA